MPTSFFSLTVELTAKPLQATYTEWTSTFQPWSSSSACSRFLLVICLIDCILPRDNQFYSEDRLAGTGPENQTWVQVDFKCKGISERLCLTCCFSPSQMKVVCCRKVALTSNELQLVYTLLTNSYRQVSWLYHQVYPPCVRLLLQPTRMCLRVANK